MRVQLAFPALQRTGFASKLRPRAQAVDTEATGAATAAQDIEPSGIFSFPKAQFFKALLVAADRLPLTTEVATAEQGFTAAVPAVARGAASIARAQALAGPPMEGLTAASRGPSRQVL